MPPLPSKDSSDLWGDLARCVADDAENFFAETSNEFAGKKVADSPTSEECAAEHFPEGPQDDEENRTYSRVARRTVQKGGIDRRNGDTALIAAARRGATQAVRALLEAGAQVNASSRRGESALDAATDASELSTAAALVLAKATVPDADDSLLRIATLAGDDALISALLASGSPALLARKPNKQFGEPPLLEDDEEAGATSCLLLAVRHPLKGVLNAYVNYFIQAGKHDELDAPHGTKRVTALMVASANARRDDASAVRQLLTAGTNFAAGDSRGRTSLHRAAASDARAAVEALAETARTRCDSTSHYRAFIDARELETSRTALHCAAAAAACAATAALLEAGADATVRDAANTTPLIIVASLQSNSSACKSKVGHAARDAIDVDDDFVTAEADSADATSVGAVGSLQQRDSTSSQHSTIMSKEQKTGLTRFELEAMTRAVADGDFSTCVELAERGNWPIDAPVELTGERATTLGDTPLVAAARRGDADAAVELLTKGKARVDARSASAESPLAIAAAKGNLNVCSALLHAGARPASELRDCGAQLLLAACRARDAPLVRKLLEVDEAYAGERTRPVYTSSHHMSEGHHDPLRLSDGTMASGTVSYLTRHFGGMASSGQVNASPRSVRPSDAQRKRTFEGEESARLNRGALRRALHAAASLADDDCVDAILSFVPSLSDLYSDVSPTAPAGILSKTPSIVTDDLASAGESGDDCAYLTQFPSVGDDREPALLAACRSNATACVTALTRERGALRAALDRERRCALHHAAALDRASLIEKLCGEDASLVSCRDSRGASSLHAAAAAGAGAAIGALLRHGADATLADAKSRTPRDVAIIRGRFDAAAQLDAMAAAIDDGDFDECARLANAGNFPIDWRSSATGDTALVAAARRGAPDAVSRLLSCGASVDARAEVPGHLRVRRTRQVHSDAQPSVPTSNEVAAKSGVTPLGAAAKAGHLDVCAALLAAGAEPTELSDRAANLLVAAVVANEPELVDALLSKGASAGAPESTPEDEEYAGWSSAGLGPARNGDDGEFEAEEDSMPDVRVGDQCGAFIVAVEVGTAEIVASFIKRAVEPGHLDVDATYGPKKMSAMHAAAVRGRPEVVRALLDAGAKVDALDADGRSALHHAAQGDHDDVLRVLVASGAHFRFKDHKGLTPLNVAQHAGAKSAESALLMAESVIRLDR